MTCTAEIAAHTAHMFESCYTGEVEIQDSASNVSKSDSINNSKRNSAGKPGKNEKKSMSQGVERSS